jgi:2-polyprenyl-3-methyl-5-hydroxy-6-metoxy-1,4-benzoquinol methylase
MTAEEYLTSHWLKKPKIYDYEHKEPNNHHHQRFQFCAENLVGNKFMDLGCACGHSTAMLKKLHDGNWSGLDFYAPVIEQAKKNFPDITFYYSPDYNYKDTIGRYDTVVCSEVIEHVPDDRLFVEKAIEIATQRVVLTTPNKNVGDPGHVRLHTMESLKELFKGYNVEIISQGIFFYITVNVK